VPMTLFSPDRGVMLVVAGMIVGIVIEITFASRLIIPWMMLGVGLLYIAQNHSSTAGNGFNSFLTPVSFFCLAASWEHLP